MKFDVVIGNPPYQATNEAGDRLSKKDNLWSRFLTKSLEVLKEDGYLSLIHPGSWMSPAAGKVGGSLFESIFKRYTLLYVNTQAADHFSGVGVGFLTWYLMKKSTGPARSTVVSAVGGDTTIDISKFTFLPNAISKESLSIVQKFFTSSEISFLHSTELNTYDKKKTYFSKHKTITHKFMNVHTGSQVLYSNVQHTLATNMKVMIPLSGYPTPIVDAGQQGLSHVVMYRLVDSQEQATNLGCLVSSKLYQFVLRSCKWSGFNSKRVIELLPVLDLSRSWTDAELYAHFNLTQEDIDLIESTIK